MIRRGFFKSLFGLLGVFSVTSQVKVEKEAYPRMLLPEGVLLVDAGWAPDCIDEYGCTVMERWCYLRFTRETPVPGSVVSLTAIVWDYLCWLRGSDRDLTGFLLKKASYTQSLYGRDLICRWQYVEIIRKVS